MNDQLELVAKSYDKGIDLGKQGMDSYDNFPPYITNHPYYPLFQQMRASETLSDSAGKEIVEYLAPKAGMKFIDLGCCLNFMFSGYKDWPSVYYGVDISSKTIDLLKGYAEKNHLTVGDLCCCSMHETPYADHFFDMGECVGSLEYFEKEFVQQAIAEFSRILKPGGRFVLDIPNLGSPEFEISKLIEEYLGRQDRFNISVEEFEAILTPYFAIDKKEIVGPVIQYRLRKEILGQISEEEEKRLLGEIYELPHFKLVQTYAKPNGYIGSGMHSWDHWKGTVLHETPLQDGEAAARLLSYYAIPKEHPLVVNFVKALRDEETLEQEFSYIPPEVERYQNRFVAIHNGNSIGALFYTMQAMLGYTQRKNAEKNHKLPYLESDEYFPKLYTLEMLAYTKAWRAKDTVQMMADALNHINQIMKPDNQMSVKIKSKYYGPFFALGTPIRAFDPNYISTVAYRRVLTEIAMLGVGERADVVRDSLAAVSAATDGEGILRMNFEQAHTKRSSFKIGYPAPYVDVQLEETYKKGPGLDCDLTFWAVQLRRLAKDAVQ